MPTIQTLTIAIASIVMERCRLLDLLDTMDAAADEDEHLSEKVMDIDLALGELSSLYNQQAATERIYPAFELLIERATADYSATR